MNGIIQGLWIGDRLSLLEQLSVRSFIANGYDYHLYAYDHVNGVPSGAVLKDANDILPQSTVFQYREYPSYAGFANSFRYKLLLDKGGWWVDMDVVCIKPFRFESDCVLATERDSAGRQIVTNAILRMPAGSEIMERAWKTCRSKTPANLRWGETGPTLMHQLTFDMSLCRHVQAPAVFCPIDWSRWFEMLLPNHHVELPDQTVAVHLWNEFWRRSGASKDERYAPGCLYEHLKRRYMSVPDKPVPKETDESGMVRT